MRVLPLAIVLSLAAACGSATTGTSASGEQALAADGSTVTAECTQARDAFAACLTEAGCDATQPPRGVPPTEEQQACREACAAEHDAMHAACPRHGRGGGDPACRERAENECATPFDALRTCFDAARTACAEEGPVCDDTGACAPGPNCQAALAACDDERAAVATCMGDCVPPDGGPGGHHGGRGPGGHHGGCDGGAPPDDGTGGAGGTGGEVGPDAA